MERMTPEDIAAKYVYGIMDAEDQNLGCQFEIEVHPLFCCQWNNRPLCSECAEIQRHVTRVIADAIREALALHSEILV